jgi:hypothetical protein
VQIITTDVSNLVARSAANPFVSELKFTLKLQKDDNIRIRVMNTRGNVLISKQVAGKSGINYMQVDGVNGLPRGNYILEVTANGQYYTQTLLKQ